MSLPRGGGRSGSARPNAIPHTQIPSNHSAIDHQDLYGVNAPYFPVFYDQDGNPMSDTSEGPDMSDFSVPQDSATAELPEAVSTTPVDEPVAAALSAEVEGVGIPTSSGMSSTPPPQPSNGKGVGDQKQPYTSHFSNDDEVEDATSPGIVDPSDRGGGMIYQARPVLQNKSASYPGPMMIPGHQYPVMPVPFPKIESSGYGQAQGFSSPGNGYGMYPANMHGAMYVPQYGPLPQMPQFNPRAPEFHPHVSMHPHALIGGMHLGSSSPSYPSGEMKVPSTPTRKHRPTTSSSSQSTGPRGRQHVESARGKARGRQYSRENGSPPLSRRTTPARRKRPVSYKDVAEDEEVTRSDDDSSSDAFQASGSEEEEEYIIKYESDEEGVSPKKDHRRGSSHRRTPRSTQKRRRPGHTEEKRPANHLKHTLFRTIHNLDDYHQKLAADFEKRQLRAAKIKETEGGFPLTAEGQMAAVQKIYNAIISINLDKIVDKKPRAKDGQNPEETNAQAVNRIKTGYYDGIDVEMACWRVLEGLRDTQGGEVFRLVKRYNGTRYESYHTFKSRLDFVCEGFTASKAMCKMVLDPSYLHRVCDAPGAEFQSKTNNKKINSQRDRDNYAGRLAQKCGFDEAAFEKMMKDKQAEEQPPKTPSKRVLQSSSSPPSSKKLKAATVPRVGPGIDDRRFMQHGPLPGVPEYRGPTGPSVPRGFDAENGGFSSGVVQFGSGSGSGNGDFVEPGGGQGGGFGGGVVQVGSGSGSGNGDLVGPGGGQGGFDPDPFGGLN